MSIYEDELLERTPKILEQVNHMRTDCGLPEGGTEVLSLQELFNLWEKDCEKSYVPTDYNEFINIKDIVDDKDRR